MVPGEDAGKKTNWIRTHIWMVRRTRARIERNILCTDFRFFFFLIHKDRDPGGVAEAIRNL